MAFLGVFCSSIARRRAQFSMNNESHRRRQRRSTIRSESCRYRRHAFVTHFIHLLGQRAETSFYLGATIGKILNNNHHVFHFLRHSHSNCCWGISLYRWSSSPTTLVKSPKEAFNCRLIKLVVVHGNEFGTRGVFGFVSREMWLCLDF